MNNSNSNTLGNIFSFMEPQSIAIYVFYFHAYVLNSTWSEQTQYKRHSSPIPSHFNATFIGMAGRLKDLRENRSLPVTGDWKLAMVTLST